MAKKASKKVYLEASEQAAFGKAFADAYAAYQAEYQAYKASDAYKANEAAREAMRVRQEPHQKIMADIVGKAYELPANERAVIGWGYGETCSLIIETVKTKKNTNSDPAASVEALNTKLAALGLKRKATETNEPEPEAEPEAKPIATKKSGKK